MSQKVVFCTIIIFMNFLHLKFASKTNEERTYAYVCFYYMDFLLSKSNEMTAIRLFTDNLILF